MRILSSLENREPTYCFAYRVMQTFTVQFSFESTFNLANTDLNRQATGLRLHLPSHQPIYYMNATCLSPFPVSSISPPILEMFLNNIWFSVFFKKFTSFVSSFKQFYIWLCANLFSWLCLLSYLWCVARSTLFLFYWKSRERKDIYSCGLRRITITLHL